MLLFTRQRRWLLSAAVAYAMMLGGCGDDGNGGGDAKCSGGECPPAAPSKLTVTADSLNTITLSWPAVVGAAAYRVYRYTVLDTGYTLIGTSMTTSYTNTKLSPTVTYYYKVSAINGAGEGAQSSQISVLILNAPTITAAASLSNSITVSWQNVTGAEWYKVYSSASDSGTYNVAAEKLTATSYTSAKLTVGATYYYKVSAYNSAGGISPQSSIDSMTVVEFGTFTDARDGTAYKTVKIGSQTWMGENLNYQTEGSLCYGDQDSNCVKYGRLYDQYTAKENCPSGYHLPSPQEWDSLVTTVGGNAGTKLKSKTVWDSTSAGTDKYGFSALPGGAYNSVNHFYSGGSAGRFWTDGSSYRFDIVDGDGTGGTFQIYRDISGENVVSGELKANALSFSVRCVQD